MNTYRKLDFWFHVSVGTFLALVMLFSGEAGIVLVLCMQFLIGVFQVFSSMIRTYHYHSFDPKIKKYLLIYWIACVVYGIGWILLYLIDHNSEIFMPYLLSAWIIASYYCYITYLLAFPKYIKSHLDI